MSDVQNQGSRKYALRMPEGWEPPYPSFMSEFEASGTGIGMVLLGCQFAAKKRAEALGFLRQAQQLMIETGAADYVDLSECKQDCAGMQQLVATGYWLDSAATASFFAADPAISFWSQHSSEDCGYGIFREVFNIPMSRYETLHSGDDHLVGVAHVRDSVTLPVSRHAYWGSMRDRIPDAAMDRFEPVGAFDVLEKNERSIKIRPNHNLAIIRSGQDIGHSTGREREQYLSEVEPSLRGGMDFLRDSGSEVNCYDCRFMRFVNEDGSAQDHTYGYAYFRSLEDLENWSEHHPSHKAIFDAFLDFAPGYGPDMQSRFWHEVSVLPAENQFAEYCNCAPDTGLLAGLNI